jgi:hypothetical protein
MAGVEGSGGDCGTSYLNQVGETWNLSLSSFGGTISFGSYSVKTNGWFAIENDMGIGSTSTNYFSGLQSFVNSGLWPTATTASGFIATSRGWICGFVVTAPWT